LLATSKLKAKTGDRELISARSDLSKRKSLNTEVTGLPFAGSITGGHREKRGLFRH
jgi:hypothetical protein